MLSEVSQAWNCTPGWNVYNSDVCGMVVSGTGETGDGQRSQGAGMQGK